MTTNGLWDGSCSSPCTEAAEFGASAAIQSDIYRSVQAVLKDLDNHTRTMSHSKGMLRWTLHKKVQENPWHCVLLVKILVKELEKVLRTQNRIYIIPLLHTLIYAVYQSVYIPADLCQRAYDVCKRLLTLPHPYCSVGLRYAKCMKTEQTAPGALYQQRILAEWNLCCTSQEKVFVFADPAVFTHALANGVAADVGLAGATCDGLDHVRLTLLHTLQTALGEACHGLKLRQSLWDLGHKVKPYFDQVVATVAQHTSGMVAGTSGYHTRLQQLYTEILMVAEQDAHGDGPLCCTPLPNPEMIFHTWREDSELWSKVVKFTQMNPMSQHLKMNVMPTPCQVAHRSVTSGVTCDRLDYTRQAVDLGALRDLPSSGMPELWRHGQMVSQSGVTGVMRESLEETLSRRSVVPQDGALSGLEEEEHTFTARIVLMGDDRAVGRLAKAYHSLRQKEAQHEFLSKNLSWEFYYIPVRDQLTMFSPREESNLPVSNLAVGSYLGKVDPWYSCNIFSLEHMIPKMMKMPSSPGRALDSDSFLQDTISYYLRTGISPVYLRIYSVKMCFSDPANPPVEDVFVCQLKADFLNFKMLNFQEACFRMKRNVTGRCGVTVLMKYRKDSIAAREQDKELVIRIPCVFINAIPSADTEDVNCLSINFGNCKNTQDPTIRTSSVKIRSLENRTFTVCLDKDLRRTFNNVQSVEISPCHDPGFSCERPTNSKLSCGQGKDDKGCLSPPSWLALPINTFSGLSH